MQCRVQRLRRSRAPSDPRKTAHTASRCLPCPQWGQSFGCPRQPPAVPVRDQYPKATSEKWSLQRKYEFSLFCPPGILTPQDGTNHPESKYNGRFSCEPIPSLWLARNVPDYSFPASVRDETLAAPLISCGTQLCCAFSENDACSHFGVYDPVRGRGYVENSRADLHFI